MYRSTYWKIETLALELGQKLEYVEIIQKVLSELSETNKYIFRSRFIEDKSQAQIAEELGVSRMTLNNWLSGKKAATEKNIASFYEYTFRKGIRLNLIKEQLYREELTEPSEVLLFHGSKTKIEGELRTDCSKRRNDFGPGFYCGESLEQSAMFVATYPASSLYMLRFCRSGLCGKEFEVSRDWMLMIAYFRERLGAYADSELIRELVQKTEGVDYIVAPIADNRMFEIIDQFIDELGDEA